MPELKARPASARKSRSASAADEAAAASAAATAADPKAAAATTTPPQPPPADPSISFAGHTRYIVGVAKENRDQDQYTDVIIRCQDGQLKAHRLVLASCSPFLRDLFMSLPEGLPEFVLLIPNIKLRVVAQLIDFLYTGRMVLKHGSTYDLQHLVQILKIDPENVLIDSPDASKKTRLVASKSKMANLVGRKAQRSPSPAPANQNRAAVGKKQPATNKEASEVKATPPGVPASMAPLKTLPARATAKRRASQDAGSAAASPNHVTNAKEPKLTYSNRNDSTTATATATSASSTPTAISLASAAADAAAVASASTPPGVGRGRGRPRGTGSANTRGRPRLASRTTLPTPTTPNNSNDDDGSATPSGFHDLNNVTTWVCAICEQYDPPAAAKTPSAGPPPKTEWVGCDCNRWYHQHCTKLKKFDDTFCCKLVKLECLPDKDGEDL